MMTALPDLPALLMAHRAGADLKYLYFWGHKPKIPGQVDACCLSNWFPAPFTIDGIIYPTTEHHMMAAKAALFHDSVVHAKILAAKSPAEAKKLGRTVNGFTDGPWYAQRRAVVLSGSLAKFRQNPELAAVLERTGEQILVEASPFDLIWGIGLSADAARAATPEQWRGLNLLGFVLMETRAQLRAESAH